MKKTWVRISWNISWSQYVSSQIWFTVGVGGPKKKVAQNDPKQSLVLEFLDNYLSTVIHSGHMYENINRN